MYLFGHLGIGSLLVSRWSKGLSRGAVLVGTILPDIIDKSLYYGLSFATGKHGAELGLISGTRTFGHTGLFLICLAAFALYRKSKIAAALALGVGSHLLLDGVSDYLGRGDQFYSESQISPLLWPFQGGHFPEYPFQSVGEHLSGVHRPVILWSEVVGFLILAWNYWNGKRKRL